MAVFQRKMKLPAYVENKISTVFMCSHIWLNLVWEGSKLQNTVEKEKVLNRRVAKENVWTFRGENDLWKL